MNISRLILLACLSLTLVFIQLLVNYNKLFSSTEKKTSRLSNTREETAGKNQNISFVKLTKKPPLSEEKLQELARSVTVRVFSNRGGGSGVLIKRDKGRYVVLTNEHVVSKRDRLYEVQTPDGLRYSAQIIAFPSSKDDVSFLSFSSPKKTYRVLPIQIHSNLILGEPVLAGGFPYINDRNQSENVNFSTGYISIILNRPFLGGYQLGYTNDIRQGMSGGPLLNQYGKLIAINGMPKQPLFGNPYVFKDGSTVSEVEWEQMSQLSWAIDVNYILKFIGIPPSQINAKF
jgi:S1-C subfamily serine protease